VNTGAANDQHMDPSASYFRSWQHLDEVARLRSRFAEAWSRFLDAEPYDISLSTDPDGNGTISVWVTWPDEAATELSGLVIDLAAHVQSALDGAIRATARLLTGQTPDEQPDSLRFPNCTTEEEFQAALDEDALRGLRPDQVRLVRSLQPIAQDEPVRPGLQMMRDALLLVRNLTSAGPALRVLSWGHSAAPELLVEPPETLEEIVVEPDGFLEEHPLVARYRLRGAQPERTRYTAVRGTANIAIDAVVNVDPPPQEPDDTLSRRTQQLARVVDEVVRSLERSMGLRDDMPAPPRPSTDPRLRVGPPPTPWTPQADSAMAMTEDELEQLRQSPLGLATVVGAEDTTLLVVTPAGVFERRIPPALPLPEELRKGTAAEWVTLSVAAAWGLPDFVFHPAKVAKGAATRELGDGTILVGQHGLVLQSKSRGSDQLRDEQGERNWLSKNMTKAGKQAAGTVRALRQQPAELVNGRGRSIWVDGNDYSWIGVVLIDHPDVPADVTTLTSSGDLPVVTLLRGDWEFLFDQLRSVHAVAQYLRRVVDDDDPPPLGQESLRYYQLAQLDEETAPSPMTPALLAMGGRPESVPLLPKTPAGSDDQRAHGLYRVLLEDVATTTLDDEMREPDRLRVLSELDKLEVASRTSLGQHLIAMLEELADEPAQHVKVRHRRFFFGQGRQLCFSVGSRFDEQMQTVFSAWVQLRHHDLQVQTGEIEQSITVAVLLTPRPDGGRRWDTTTVAVHGDLGLTEEQTTTWRQAFDDASSRAEAASGGPADDATS
jgi:hypothetical protein